MNFPQPDLTQVVPSEETGLSEAAQIEILRTFNSLTNAYATLAEYTSHWFPSATVWPGDDCGCTDDRCTGHHHSAGEECGCLNVHLDTFHDDLSSAYVIREWLATYSDKEAAVAALEGLRDEHRGLKSRLNASQQAALDELFVSAGHLEPADVSQALQRLGIVVVRPRPSSS